MSVPIRKGRDGNGTASCAATRAARELGLMRAEFDLAVQLGRIRTVRGQQPGERRVTHAEIHRVRAQTGFPDSLRERVRTVGTSEGAELLGISTVRFTKLARLGRFTPVLYYRNRYRATVWQYLAEDLRDFAADPGHRALLSGRTPAPLREQLAAGVDVRARNWRGRYHGRLLRLADGPWESAAATAAFLDEERVMEVTADPEELTRLRSLLPKRQVLVTGNRSAAANAPDLMRAEDTDEAGWYQTHLALCLDHARASTAPSSSPALAPRAADRAPEPPLRDRSRRLRDWLRRRD
ncbi:DUF6397 family protein [Streptomyces sp. JNUCC 64]